MYFSRWCYYGYVSEDLTLHDRSNATANNERIDSGLFEAMKSMSTTHDNQIEELLVKRVYLDVCQLLDV